VQLCWLAYPGTTGLTAMDYRVTDPHLDGPDSDFGVYAERTLSLPDTFWCYEPGSTVQPNGLPAASGGRFTFGCLNSHMKLNAEVTALWARILAAAPTADLILQAPLNDIRRRLLSAFADQGVDASRVIFSDSVPYHEYLALYHRIDACLDPFPCGGHTTSLDAFWMGLPVVTLRSPSKVVGRAAAGFATTLGLPELVASTPDEYVQIALGLTIDLARLAQWRSELRARIEASPLMDAPRFARSMEALYRKAWSEWVRRRSPGRNEGSGDGPQER